MSDDPLYYARLQEIADGLETRGQMILGLQLSLSVLCMSLVNNGTLDREKLIANLREAERRAMDQETKSGTMSFSVTGLLQALKAP